MEIKSSQKGKTKIVATTYNVHYISVINAATVVQAVMDRQFIDEFSDESRGWFWADPKDAVDSEGRLLERGAWYKINREKEVLEKITEKEAYSLGRERWYERLYVVSTKSIRWGYPVAVAVSNYSARIEIHENYNTMYVPIAQIDSKQSGNGELLRK